MGNPLGDQRFLALWKLVLLLQESRVASFLRMQHCCLAGLPVCSSEASGMLCVKGAGFAGPGAGCLFVLSLQASPASCARTQGGACRAGASPPNLWEVNLSSGSCPTWVKWPTRTASRCSCGKATWGKGSSETDDEKPTPPAVRSETDCVALSS